MKVKHYFSDLLLPHKIINMSFVGNTHKYHERNQFFIRDIKLTSIFNDDHF
jgi:hypothetical protein